MTPPPPPQSIQFISDCFVKPPTLSPHQNRPVHLPPFDLAMLSDVLNPVSGNPTIPSLSFHYIQKGLLFPLPPHCLHPGFDRPSFIHSFLEKLKRSLSSTLTHFYPLATLKQADPPFHIVFVDCASSLGAQFIHAALNLNMANILSPMYVPAIIQSFFDRNRAIDHDGHILSLLSVQVIELSDGIFIGLSMNHAISNGTSFWLFFNSWSEIFQLSRPSVLTRRFLENHPGPVSLPYTDDTSSFLTCYEAAELRERVFHFSTDAISLIAIVWWYITRARCFPPSQVTSSRMAADNRARLHPPLPLEYFGNSVTPLRVAVTVGELLGKGFNMHGNEFELGKAVALQSEYTHKFNGKVSAYPGREGGGSIDVEICLPLTTMALSKMTLNSLT
ncbi:hypothetical protein ACJRO7_022405 [Eucalyptus globulus]|uniref:HXXXD-type acyl-transferase family protein n=1 Tax=Eucalyptus globulus TaxID=34317 RepID=A0ABD3JZN9_EUCGL